MAKGDVTVGLTGEEFRAEGSLSSGRKGPAMVQGWCYPQRGFWRTDNPELNGALLYIAGWTLGICAAVLGLWAVVAVLR